MIERKYASKQIGKMNDNEISIATLAILIKINSITGWIFSPSEDAQNILVDQLSKRLFEAYHGLNLEEIEYAFRSTSVKDWGKSLNVSLINEVLDEYLAQRRVASEMEERLHPVKELPPPVVDSTPEEWIEIARGIWNYSHNYQMLPYNVYDILKLNPPEEERIPIRQKVEFDLKEKERTDKYFLQNISRRSMLNRMAMQCAIAEYFKKETPAKI